MADLSPGRGSIRPQRPVYLNHWASIAGKKEAAGPLGRLYDFCSADSRFGETSWEQAESRMQHLALQTLLRKAGLPPDRLDLVLSGDLLNQCIGSSFPLRNTGIPHLGLYGACSTMAQALVVGTMAVGGGFADCAAAMTSSHFASAERQYRFPLGYGGQRTPTAQWTVTGSGAVLLSASPGPVRITSATIGTVTDLGITDASDMGAAMAPAAAATIRRHLENLGEAPECYDLVVTGDLGALGLRALEALLERDGIRFGERLTDCGRMVYDAAAQHVHAGGSGCGCSAIVLCALLLRRLMSGALGKILFCGTGALLSPTSTQQKLPIPGICHAVCLESGREPWHI